MSRSVLKRRETRLEREQADLRSLVFGLVGGIMQVHGIVPLPYPRRFQ